VKMFGYDAQQHVWGDPNAAYQHKGLIPTVKHGGGAVINWVCSAATGPYTKVFLSQLRDYLSVR